MFCIMEIIEFLLTLSGGENSRYWPILDRFWQNAARVQDQQWCAVEVYLSNNEINCNNLHFHLGEDM